MVTIPILLFTDRLLYFESTVHVGFKPGQTTARLRGDKEGVSRLARTNHASANRRYDLLKGVRQGISSADA